MKAGDEAVGNFFRDVRIRLGYRDKLYEFAKLLVKPDGRSLDGGYLGRVERAKRLPGLDALAAIEPFAVKANMDIAELLAAWLRAQGLGPYSEIVRTPKRRPRRRE